MTSPRRAGSTPQSPDQPPNGAPGVTFTAPDASSDKRTAGREVLTDADVGRTISRIAHEVLEQTGGGEDVVLLGIPTRGVALARRLAQRIADFEGLTVPIGSLDTTMYRDDLRLRGIRPVGRTELPGSVDGKVVVLVDDVLYSGRTVRAALDALNDLGRPRKVQLAVLVDRGHRELPIRADYVGKNLPTHQGETVRVLLADVDGRDAVVIERRAAAEPGRPAAIEPGRPAAIEPGRPAARERRG